MQRLVAVHTLCRSTASVPNLLGCTGGLRRLPTCVDESRGDGGDRRRLVFHGRARLVLAEPGLEPVDGGLDGLLLRLLQKGKGDRNQPRNDDWPGEGKDPSSRHARDLLVALAFETGGGGDVQSSS